jgi:hypothetical protein
MYFLWFFGFHWTIGRRLETATVPTPLWYLFQSADRRKPVGFLENCMELSELPSGNQTNISLVFTEYRLDKLDTKKVTMQSYPTVFFDYVGLLRHILFSLNISHHTTGTHRLWSKTYKNHSSSWLGCGHTCHYSESLCGSMYHDDRHQSGPPRNRSVCCL